MRLLTFRSTSSHVMPSIIGPLKTIVLHSFSQSTLRLLFLKSLSLSLCVGRVSRSLYGVRMWILLGVGGPLPRVFVLEGILRWWNLWPWLPVWGLMPMWAILLGVPGHFPKRKVCPLGIVRYVLMLTAPFCVRRVSSLAIAMLSSMRQWKD